MSILNATHSAADLDRRSRMATRLKYGANTHLSLTGARATNIAFPAGLAPVPTPITPTPAPTDPLPQVDVIAMMDTAPEARAMADVPTPGVDATAWYPYAENFETKYLPLIGPMGPSRESQRLGSYYLTIIGGLRVLVYKTELHMHEDAIKLPDGSMSLPIKLMLQQMIAEAQPKVFLTTGTSGGVYPQMSLGDVVVSHAAQFQCLRDFKDAPFNGKKFESKWTTPASHFEVARALMQDFAQHLTGASEPKGTPPNADCGCAQQPAYPTRIYCDGCTTPVIGKIPSFHPILTTDIFAFGTTTNELWKLGMAVEMDDACLGLACSELASPPRWACVRNCSDPVINGALDAEAQDGCADYYYSKFGYWTTVMSALATWGIIAGIGAQGHTEGHHEAR